MLVILLIPSYGLRIDRVTKLLVAFASLVVLSGLINGSSLVQIFMFMRYVVIPYLIYYLARTYLTPERIRKVLGLAVVLAMLQLPIVVIQRLFAEQLLSLNQSNIAIIPVDFVYGTFYIKSDSVLSFFILCLLAFILFYNEQFKLVRQ